MVFDFFSKECFIQTFVGVGEWAPVPFLKFQPNQKAFILTKYLYTNSDDYQWKILI